MPDAYETLRVGEKRPFYGQVTADSGTLTIQPSSPAPTVTLYDSAGAPVAGVNGAAVTAYDSAAAATVKAIYNLDAAALAAGVYTLVFNFAALASADGLIRIYRPSVRLRVEPPYA